MPERLPSSAAGRAAARSCRAAQLRQFKPNPRHPRTRVAPHEEGDWGAQQRARRLPSHQLRHWQRLGEAAGGAAAQHRRQLRQRGRGAGQRGCPPVEHTGRRLLNLNEQGHARPASQIKPKQCLSSRDGARARVPVPPAHPAPAQPRSPPRPSGASPRGAPAAGFEAERSGTGRPPAWSLFRAADACRGSHSGSNRKAKQPLFCTWAAQLSSSSTMPSAASAAGSTGRPSGPPPAWYGARSRARGLNASGSSSAAEQRALRSGRGRAGGCQGRGAELQGHAEMSRHTCPAAPLAAPLPHRALT